MSVFDPQAYQLSATALPTFVVTVGALMLALLVMAGERFSRASVSFLLTCVSIALWLGAFTVMYSTADRGVALLWARVAYLGVPFIPTTIYQFAVHVLDLKGRRAPLRIAWLGSALFSGCILTTDWLIAEVYHYGWGYYPKYGWLSVPYLLFFFGYMILTLAEYWKAWQAAPAGSQRRARAQAFLVSYAVAYIGSVDYLAKYGIPVYPFGYAPIFVYLLLAARALWRHQLVEVTPALAAEQIITTMKDPLLVVDREGIVRVANTEACKLLGGQAGDVLGQPLPLAAAGLMPGERWNALLRGDAVPNFQVTLGDGPTARLFDVVLSPVRPRREAAPQAVVCTARDMTEERRHQQALSAKVEELQRLNKIMTGREERILELKTEVKTLQERLGGQAPSNGRAAHG